MRIQRLAGLLLAAAVPVGAQAAPQMLGLARTVGLTPLHCAGGECTAELTAFCLQQERDMPRAGTVYVPAPGSGDHRTPPTPRRARRRIACATGVSPWSAS